MIKRIKGTLLWCAYEIAINNNNVVVNQSDPFNSERFYEFLSNVEKGIPDKIRITRYGFDNPEMALRTILEYNGTYYIFTITGDTTSPKSYYGNELTLKRRTPDTHGNTSLIHMRERSTSLYFI
ncbi:hypothetical protein R2R35_18715 [Anaerocolumna sp. AGMB13020]|uniref:hypothetical protein n=1 Tax=Anaerocolumna sp. AGMB13020 TaxID=3081750 RepID=UPI0029549968|nr:hypothetical protein [Anaerocolumna sp. AGMB13020]WOO35813.1 hypothetical protein R2R35_18715 [Anaerocolumna sp. AGMB13020]